MFPDLGVSAALVVGGVALISNWSTQRAASAAIQQVWAHHRLPGRQAVMLNTKSGVGSSRSLLLLVALSVSASRWWRGSLRGRWRFLA